MVILSDITLRMIKHLFAAILLTVSSVAVGADVSMEFNPSVESLIERGKYAEAVEELKILAGRGDIAAQVRLGMIYLIGGLDVAPDYTQAALWYRKAAEQGHAGAQSTLGSLYSGGLGIPENYAEAVKWFGKAADQGDAHGQVSLGMAYESGSGVPQDYAEAAKWYRKAAVQGNSMAQKRLGFAYSNGRGVPQDYRQAFNWYRKAAEQGVHEAQTNLGLMYAEGQGVRQDYVRAYAWLNISAARGSDVATQNRDLLGSKMTPNQLEEAEKLSDELYEKYESEIDVLLNNL